MANPAEGYESYMVPTLFAPCAKILIQAAGPKPDEHVLDVGCGTGIVAREIALRLGATAAVTAVDLSANMLSVARSTAAREGLTIEWREGNAEQLPFRDATFDLVLCQFALMFVTDKAAALSEMRRVVTESGRVLISVWQGLDRHPFYQTLHNVIQRRLGMSALHEIFALGNADDLRGLVLGSRVSPSGNKAFFSDGTFSESRSLYCWRNRGRYRRDSFDAAPRIQSSGSNCHSDHQRYAVAVKKADIG